ncbi:glutaredoxin family protein [Corynebacterium sp. USCH3]|uniref:glutaredoxin family protein n=1 Tax=Corynebacterium sp. USCH3 TaxID=3024840 RepID=UPI0030B7DBAA
MDHGSQTPPAVLAAPVVTLMVRATCGSCTRVRAQITPVCAEHGASLQVVDVDTDGASAVEFGDRVPVVLVDDEEIACWEIDDEDLVDALVSARRGTGA